MRFVYLLQWDSNTFTKSLATIRFRDIERVNDISFSKMEPGKISVSTSSGNVIFWDVRTQMPQQTLRHGCDVLTHDVSKFEPNIVVTGGVNRAILVWDLRNCRYPVVVLHGHSHPVKKIVTSFHSRPEFTSTSFDFSVRLFLTLYIFKSWVLFSVINDGNTWSWGEGIIHRCTVIFNFFWGG